MSGYSMDLRERVINLWELGKTQQWIADTLSISISTVKRYIQRYKHSGTVQATQQERMKPTLRDAQLPALVSQLEANRDGTLEQQVALWEGSHGVRLSKSTMWRAIARAGWTYKKRVWVPKNVTW